MMRAMTSRKWAWSMIVLSWVKNPRAGAKRKREYILGWLFSIYKNYIEQTIAGLFCVSSHLIDIAYF